MIRFQDDEQLLDFGSHARAKNTLDSLGFSCVRSGSAYCYSGGKYISVPANTYRICSDGGVAGLVVEEEQENLMLYSSEDNAAWISSGSAPTRASATSVIDGKTAIKLTRTGANSAIYQTVGTLSGSNECLQMIIEEGTGDVATILAWNHTAGSTIASVKLTFSTGLASVVSGSPVSYGVRVITPVGPNGGKLYLLWMVYSGTAGNIRREYFYPANTGSGYTYLHHAQLVESGQVTSPIVTGAASATRMADVISSSSIASFLNTGTVTLISEVATVNTADDRYIFAATDGTANNAFYSAVVSGGSGAGLVVGGVTYSSSVAQSPNIGSRSTICATFNNSILYSAIDGTKGANGSPVAVNSFSAMDIGCALSAYYFFNGKILSLKFIKTALPNLEDYC